MTIHRKEESWRRQRSIFLDKGIWKIIAGLTVFKMSHVPVRGIIQEDFNYDEKRRTETCKRVG